MLTNLMKLPNDLKNLFIEMLDDEVVNQNSSILNLRATNKYFYNIINFYWENKHAIQQIVTRDGSTYILLRNGELYVCGLKNNFGPVFDPSNIGSEKFIKVNSGNPKFKKIFSSNSMFIGLTEDNNLYGAGNTHHLGLNALSIAKNKQLSNGYSILTIKSKTYGKDFNTTFTEEFEEIAPHIQSIKDVSISNNHVLLLDDKGNVYACGNNCCGQLGTGDDNNLDQFVKIFEHAEKIFATDYNSFIVSQGVLYAIGLNYEKTITNQSTIDVNTVSFPIPMLNVDNPNFIKKIFPHPLYSGYVFLYDNGDVYLMEVLQSKILLATGIDNVYGVRLGKQRGLLTLGKDGLLSYNGDYLDKLLVNSSSNNYFSKFKSILGDILINFCPLISTNLTKRITSITRHYCDTVVADQVIDVSNVSSQFFGSSIHSDTNDIYLDGALFFFRDNAKRLYASGYNCFKGQLGLGLSTHETNGSYNKVEVNLPIKNRLSQGKALMI